jgi:hypothetical protein
MDSGKRNALARDAAALVEGGDAALDKIAVPVGLSVVFDRLYAVRVRRDDRVDAALFGLSFFSVSAAAGLSMGPSKGLPWGALRRAGQDRRWTGHRRDHQDLAA